MATLLPPGQAGGFDRCLDALTGGLIGLAVAAVLPTDPVTPVRGQARRLLEEMACVLDGVAEALRSRDADAASAALHRARATQPLVDELRTAIQAGREVTSVAPLRRRRRLVLGKFAELAERADYAMRNTRVVARRCYTLLADGHPPRDGLAAALGRLATVVERFTAELGREGERERMREPLLELSRDSLALDTRGWSTSEVVIAAQPRSIVLDLLQGIGLSRTAALAGMRSGPTPSPE